jgi:myosin heavy subunit
MGLLALLDEESNFPKGTDLSLLEKMEKNHSAHPNFEKPKIANNGFCVKHYAGKVITLFSSFSSFF